MMKMGLSMMEMDNGLSVLLLSNLLLICLILVNVLSLFLHFVKFKDECGIYN